MRFLRIKKRFNSFVQKNFFIKSYFWAFIDFYAMKFPRIERRVRHFSKLESIQRGLINGDLLNLCEKLSYN